MQTTKMTASVWRSLETRLVELNERIGALELGMHGDDPFDEALHAQLSNERNQIADALVRAALIDNEPFDTHAIELGDTVTVRDLQDGSEQRYVLVDGTVGSRLQEDWVSATSPLGAALVGRSKNDEIVVDSPGGRTRYLVLAFERRLDPEMLT